MVLGRMRMKKTPDGKVYASVAVRLTDPGSARLVTDRYDEYLQYGSQGKPVAAVVIDESLEPSTVPDTEEHLPPDPYRERVLKE